MPARALSEDEQAKNNLPDLLARWQDRAAETDRPRTAQSFMVAKADIVAAGYDLSLNRYKEVVHAEVTHDTPGAIIKKLRDLEMEIAKGLTALDGIAGVSWPLVTLDEVCEINVGRTPSRDESGYWESGEHLWVSIGDMSRSRHIANTKEMFSERARRECGMKPVRAGTVLMSFKLSIGKIAFARERALYE